MKVLTDEGLVIPLYAAYSRRCGLNDTRGSAAAAELVRDAFELAHGLKSSRTHGAFLAHRPVVPPNAHLIETTAAGNRSRAVRPADTFTVSGSGGASGMIFFVGREDREWHVGVMNVDHAERVTTAIKHDFEAVG